MLLVPFHFTEEKHLEVYSFKSYTMFSFQIFDLLPVRKATFIPYEVQDPIECMEVRPKRSILPFPDFDKNDAYTVFQVMNMDLSVII